jgi:glycosyltransferase involved in cell wall biosynthesis
MIAAPELLYALSIFCAALFLNYPLTKKPFSEAEGNWFYWPVFAHKGFRPWPTAMREMVSPLGLAAPPHEADNAEAQRQAFANAFPELDNTRQILFLSRIHHKKGCDLLIKAFAALADQDPSLRLVMAGPDQAGWKTELAALAQDLGVAERIVWTGMLTGDLKWGAFRSAEVFALTSHQENFGFVVPEALACGTPVLISDKVNIFREVVEDGAGFSATDDDAGAKDLLARWLGLTPEERAAMSDKARACFTKRFEIGAATDALLHKIVTHVG